MCCGEGKYLKNSDKNQGDKIYMVFRKVIDNEFQDRSTQKISELNRIIKDDTRVDITMLPVINFIDYKN